MTYEELASRTLLKEYLVSEGDTLNKVAYILYGSNEPLYIRALVRLNPTYNWANLKAGQAIKYLEKVNLQQVNEIY